MARASQLPIGGPNQIGATHGFVHPSEANSRWILIENQDRLRIGDRVQIPFPDELGRAQAVSVARGIIEDREERGDRRWLVGK